MLLFFKGKDVGFIAGWNIRGQVEHFHPELLPAQGLNPFDIARLLLAGFSKFPLTFPCKPKNIS